MKVDEGIFFAPMSLVERSMASSAIASGSIAGRAAGRIRTRLRCAGRVVRRWRRRRGCRRCAWWRRRCRSTWRWRTRFACPRSRRRRPAGLSGRRLRTRFSRSSASWTLASVGIATMAAIPQIEHRGKETPSGVASPRYSSGVANVALSRASARVAAIGIPRQRTRICEALASVGRRPVSRLPRSSPTRATRSRRRRRARRLLRASTRRPRVCSPGFACANPATRADDSSLLPSDSQPSESPTGCPADRHRRHPEGRLSATDGDRLTVLCRRCRGTCRNPRRRRRSGSGPPDRSRSGSRPGAAL